VTIKKIGVVLVDGHEARFAGAAFGVAELCCTALVVSDARHSRRREILGERRANWAKMA